jgi:hypothetical protein
MTPPPDPASIDWNGIGLWAGGVATVLASIGVAVWAAINRAASVAAGLPPQAPAVHQTDVYTTDTVAMHELAGALEANNTLVTEGNALRREATDERRTLRQALDENTEATEKNVAAMSELRADVRRLTDELIRAGGRMR